MIIVPSMTPVVVDWILFLVTSAFVFCRIYIQTIYLRTFDKGDYALLFAYIAFLAVIIQDAIVYRTGTFNPEIQFIKHELPDFEKFIIDAKLLSRALKVLYSSNAMLYIALYLVKAAFLALYFKLIPPTMKRMRIALIFATWFTLIGLVATLGFNLFWCQPVSRNWTLVPSHRCLAYSNLIPYFLTVFFHLFSDLFIYTLPFCLLPSLIRRSQRSLYGVVTIFSLGLFCILSTVARLICVGVATSLPLFSALASLELGIALLVACCPSIKTGWDLRFYQHRQFASQSRTIQCTIDGSPKDHEEHAKSEQIKRQVDKEEDEIYHERQSGLIQKTSVQSKAGHTRTLIENKTLAPRTKVKDDLADLSLDIHDLAFNTDQDTDIGGLAPRERKVSYPANSSLEVKVDDTRGDTSRANLMQEGNIDISHAERKLSSVSRKLSLSSRQKGSVSGKAGGYGKNPDEVGLSTFGDVETVL